MWDNIIGKHIQRSNRNLIVTNVLLILAVLIVAIANANYLRGFCFGPTALSGQAAEQLGDLESVRQTFVTVHGDRAADTGLQQIEQERDEASNRVESERVAAAYTVLLVGHHVLIVQGPPSSKETTVTGTLVPLPSDVRTHVIIAAGNDQALAKLLLPVMLDASSDYRTPGYWGMPIALLVLCLAAWNLRHGLERLRHPERHPAARTLERFGPPATVAGEIDQEVRTTGHKIKDIILTPTWLLRSSLYGLDVLKLDEIVWIYQKVTRHYTNFIPSGKSFSAILVTNRGAQHEWQYRKNQVEEILQQIAERVPWVLVGFDPKLVALWHQNPAAVIDAVSERRHTLYLKDLEERRQQAEDAATIVKTGPAEAPSHDSEASGPQESVSGETPGET